jgi:hypothetical protein
LKSAVLLRSHATSARVMASTMASRGLSEARICDDDCAISAIVVIGDSRERYLCLDGFKLITIASLRLSPQSYKGHL